LGLEKNQVANPAGRPIGLLVVGHPQGVSVAALYSSLSIQRRPDAGIHLDPRNVAKFGSDELEMECRRAAVLLARHLTVGGSPAISTTAGSDDVVASRITRRRGAWIRGQVGYPLG
jgi:hypothetical protein